MGQDQWTRWCDTEELAERVAVLADRWDPQPPGLAGRVTIEVTLTRMAAVWASSP